MKCENFQQLIDDLLDDALDEAVLNECQNHVLSCRECQSKLTIAQMYRKKLRRAPVAQTPSNLLSDSIRKASSTVTAASSKQKRGVGTFGGGFATAAGLFLCVSVVFMLVQNQEKENLAVAPEKGALTTVAARVAQQQNVKLLFSAPAVLEQAQISIMLPVDIELAGFPGKREISWHANLKQGQNLLQLPVIAKRATDGELIARIEHEGKVKIFRVRVTASQGLTRSIERGVLS